MSEIRNQLSVRVQPMTPELREECHKLIERLNLLHVMAHTLGLHKTGHRLHDAVRAAGYELAEILEDQELEEVQIREAIDRHLPDIVRERLGENSEESQLD